VYAVVPTELELSGATDAEVKQPSSLIAVSQDGGAGWKFLNGAGVGGDRSKLKRLLPNFPEQLKLVAAESPVWDHDGQFSHSLGPPKTLSRPGFTFEHPSTWTVDDKDKHYDPDHLFTIDASVGAMVMFVIADAELVPAKTLAINVQAQSKRITNAVQTEFDRWGNYDGRGVVLRGKVVGLIPATVRLFAFNAEGRTVTVIEFYPDDEKKQLALGFQTIENSFRVLQ
jgi:hypothetical protein